MPRAKGQGNYKVDALILVVEELLLNGAQGWEEVAALYQAHSGEMILWDHDDVKWHWIEKCCNKFKNPTGNPGDPKRDMILRYQRIWQRIHTKTSTTIMGVDSFRDDGLDLDEDDEEEEVMAAAGEEMATEALIGDQANSRIGTPTNV
jgi:hypothetical protein